MSLAAPGFEAPLHQPRSPAVSPPADRFGRHHPTRNLKRLMQGLTACTSPHLLDLGRLCGQNIEWLIHRGCKVTVDDQVTPLRPVAPPPPPSPNRPTKKMAAPAVVALELQHPAESFDAVLCWDLFDYLDVAGAHLSLTRLAELLKPKGYLLAFFNCQRAAARPATRYRIVGEDQLDYEPQPQTILPGRIYENREIQELFADFDLVNSCFLTNQMREILVQKKAPRLRR